MVGFFRHRLLGSRARGDNNSASDYDIAVFSDNTDASEETRFANDIDNIKTLHIYDEEDASKNYNRICVNHITLFDSLQNKLADLTE
ncbi:MAG: nucleotidyltransferase domain-containing protein [Oscillospiraceae bacterium]|nr:nucleotidyltransferase domain-containing protein [Oscillospiraceae bacterium]